ncbi:hypothetical protein DSUL_20467 [Desulfovibrionales bacterium]
MDIKATAFVHSQTIDGTLIIFNLMIFKDMKGHATALPPPPD